MHFNRLLITVLLSTTITGVGSNIGNRSTATATQTASIPAGVNKLIKVYPEFIRGFKDNKLILSNGMNIPWDDGKKKSFTEMLDNTDAQDMFITTYPATGATPKHLADPGRGRCEPLFKAMYGNSAAEVERHLVSVSWFGQRLRFTSRNGAADSLRAVARELSKHPELKKYLKSAGTFYWRKVRGAQRQSAHSYGIAIDIGGNYTDYWKWRQPRAAETDNIEYRNRIPHTLVDIFRRHGFIWGGAWYHYDTMHFEFRPELLN